LDIPGEIARRQERLPAIEVAKARLGYRKRKWIADPPNGWIKNVLGFRQFSMRGLEKAKAEFKLVCLALSLRRMGGNADRLKEETGPNHPCKRRIRPCPSCFITEQSKTT